jgi:hypothetical protein
MYSSVKFFEPTVIVGFLAFSALRWINFPPSAVVAAVLPPEPELSLSSSPQAASPRARTASAAVVAVRNFIGDLLFGRSSLSPRGVIPRCTEARHSSAATARAATRIAVPRRPSSPWTLALMIGSPSVATPK